MRWSFVNIEREISSELYEIGSHLAQHEDSASLVTVVDALTSSHYGGILQSILKTSGMPKRGDLCEKVDFVRHAKQVP